MIRCRKCSRFYSQLIKGPCPHCPEEVAPSGGAMRKGWATPHGFGDFQEPVTYEEACERMKRVAGQMQQLFNRVQ